MSREQHFCATFSYDKCEILRENLEKNPLESLSNVLSRVKVFLSKYEQIALLMVMNWTPLRHVFILHNI